jgi:hypothetical protein
MLITVKYKEVLGASAGTVAAYLHLEDKMKKLVLAAAIAAAASTASAGTMEEPIMEAPVIVQETAASSSAAGIWVPLVLLAIVAAVVAAD